MATVCVVPEYKAKVKIFKVAQPYQADLLVFVVEHSYQAKGDALWYMEKTPKSNTTTITWVTNPSKADIKVAFVNQAYQAKWSKPNNFQNRL